MSMSFAGIAWETGTVWTDTMHAADKSADGALGRHVFYSRNRSEDGEGFKWKRLVSFMLCKIDGRIPMLFGSLCVWGIPLTFRCLWS